MPTSISIPENPSQYYAPIYTCVLQAILTLRFLPQILFATLLSPIHATRTAHLILLDLVTQIMFGEQYSSLSSSLCSFLHSPDTPSLLYPHMLLNTIFPNSFSLLNYHTLHFSRNVSDTVSYPHKTAGEVIFQYILIFIFLGANWK